MMIAIGRPQTPEQMEEYFELRWRILRAPWDQPRGSERDEFDDSADHMTARDDTGQLIGVGRLHQNHSNEAQIRYVATKAGHRGKGVGQALMRNLEQVAIAQGALRIKINARNSVVDFYEHLGYCVIGNGPTLYGVIRHTRMEKWLDDDDRSTRNVTK